MPVRMRLQRGGRKKKPVYSIVIADSRAPRDGKFIEKLGQYNPNTIPATIELNNEKALEWLHKGASPSNTVRAILSFKGVLFMKHLQRGVTKGAFSQEEADKKYEEWFSGKSQAIDSRRDKHKADLFAKNEEVIKAGAEKAAALAAARLATANQENEAVQEAADEAKAISDEAQSNAEEAKATPEETKATPEEAKVNSEEAQAIIDEVEENTPNTESKKETLADAKEEE